MDWSARLDTGDIVGPAEAGTAALVAMRAAIAGVGAALKGYDGDAAASSLAAQAAAADRAAASYNKAAGAARQAGDAGKKAKRSAADGLGAGAADGLKLDTRKNFSKQAKDGFSVSASSKEELAARIKDRDRLVQEEAAKEKDRVKAFEAADKSAKKKEALEKRNKEKSLADRKAAAAAAGSNVVAGLTKAAAFAGVGLGAAGLAKIAIGYRGMNQLLGIQARAEFGFRQLFRGVDASPLIRAADRFSRNFTAATVTGRAMGDVFTRAFNGIFKAVEAAEPYVTAFTGGVVLGFLYIENAVLRARIALRPYSSILDEAASSSTLFKAAAIGGGLAVAAAGVYVAVAAAPFLALAAAIMAVASAFEQATKLAKEWDENSGSQIWAKLKQDLGVTTADERNKQSGTLTGDDWDKAQEAKAKAAGQATGAAMGAGVVEGLNGAEAGARAAGEKLAAAADAGVKAKAEIRSPSRLFRRRARQMGDGTAGGLEDSADRVNKAAASSLVPDPAIFGGGGSKGGGGLVINGPLIGSVVIQGGGGEGLQPEMRRVLDVEVMHVVEALGLSLARS